MNILICDDDKEIAHAIAIYLKAENYSTLLAHDGLQALEIVKNNDIHLIIMDIMMPNMDGYEATLAIREKENIPIIMLSAKGEDTDKVLGLNIGADDYVTKPFNPLELVARVKSQMRRYVTLGSLPQTDNEKDMILRTGGIELSDAKKQVLVDGEQAHLTPIEYKILLLLMQNLGRVFSIGQIYENVWEEEAYSADNTVAVHIRRIREKIEINPKEPKYLKVVWGIGYKMEQLDL